MTPAPDGAGRTPRRPSRLRVLVVFAAVLAVPVVAMLLTAPRGSLAPRGEDVTVGRVLLESVLAFVFAGFLLLVGGAAYLLVVFTGCFTFDYTRPAYKRTKTRVFLANLVVLLFLSLGLALLGQAVLAVPFKLLRLPFSPLIVALVASVLATNLLAMRVNIWAPLERRWGMARQRGLGTPEGQIARGTLVGISNPADAAWKKTFLEDDVGMMWLEPDRIAYRGDAEAFSFSGAELLEIEREVLASSTSAYAGNRHIVLRFLEQTGRERRVRLHVEGEWTLGRVVEATDRLADRLLAWARQSGAATGAPA